MPGDIKVPIVDNRAALQGKPGLHAFIVGVSGYPHLPASENEPSNPQGLGMRRLTSTSLTAQVMYRWLFDRDAKGLLPVPLATCRLLLSPSTTELAIDQTLGNAPAATVDNFLQAADAWRTDAASDQKNVTLFYFAGHGVQREKGDAVLLLEEFGNGLGPTLLKAVDMHSIVYGMTTSATRPNMAQTCADPVLLRGRVPQPSKGDPELCEPPDLRPVRRRPAGGGHPLRPDLLRGGTGHQSRRRAG